MRRRLSGPVPAPPVKDCPSLDHAWKALASATDLIKHVEVKTGVTLAASAATAGALFNLVKATEFTSAYLTVPALLCAAGVASAGVCGAAALWPRLHPRDGLTSELFFGHVVRRGGSAPAQFISDTYALLGDDERLARELIGQVWASACIARTKYHWSKLALISLLTAVVNLLAAALVALA